MALPLPDLDDRAFADLVDEARALIVTYDPAWTDHNPSDPGITLIELFAWLAEMLVYRTNRVPDRHLSTFLKLLNGPDWQPGPDLSEDIRASIVALRQRDRAITSEDYEELARTAAPGIARTRCVPGRYLGAGTESERTRPQPGHVSVIVVPVEGPQPSQALVGSVEDYLDSRRLVTVRTHVVGPVYAPVGAEILVARRADVRAEDLRPRIVDALQRFLDPVAGGADGGGWTFGRAVYVSELYGLLEGIAGVDYVPDVVLSSRCPPGASRCVPAQPLWNDDAELVALGLAAHHLPQASIDPAAVVIAARFVAVQVAIRVNLPAGTRQDEARRLARAAVNRFLHPLHGGPDGTAVRVVPVESISGAVQLALGLRGEDVAVGLGGDPAHLLLDDAGAVTGLRVLAGELVDAQVTVAAS